MAYMSSLISTIFGFTVLKLNGYWCYFWEQRISYIIPFFSITKILYNHIDALPNREFLFLFLQNFINAILQKKKKNVGFAICVH